MRFVVIGAGGVGSVLAGYLARAGESVIMVAREAHAREVTTHGLRVVEERGETWVVRPHAVATITECRLRPDDLVMCTAKSYDTEAIVRDLVIAQPGGPAAFICVQNGVRNEAVAAALLPHVYGAMARFGGRLLEPGSVYAPGTHHLIFGRYVSGLDDLIEEVARCCAASGIQIGTTPEIMRHKWSKLVTNCANAIYAVTNTQTDQAWGDCTLAALVNRVWAEAEEVLSRAGIAHEPVPPISLSHPPVARRRGPGVIEFYGSTWDDLALRKGRTEVDWFNGEIVRLAQVHGVDAPLNRLLLNACTDMALSGEAPGRHTVAELVAMAGKASPAPTGVGAAIDESTGIAC